MVYPAFLAPAMDIFQVPMFVVIVVFRVHNVYCCHCLVYPAFVVPAMDMFVLVSLYVLLFCFVFTLFDYMVVELDGGLHFLLGNGLGELLIRFMTFGTASIVATASRVKRSASLRQTLVKP